MLRVLKPGRVLLLEHYVDEAESAGYEGLHQWNLRPEVDGSFSIWNRRARYVVNDVFPETSIECARGEGRWFSVDLRKPGPPAEASSP
jgi:hypothetical protein